MSFMRNLTLTILLLMSLTEAFAACPPRMRGINLVPLPSGWYNGAVEMQFPTATQIAYYKSVGMNSIRLPIHWEDLQPILGNDLDARFIGHTVDFLDQAHAQGMKVLIDLHNYARYRNQLVGSPAVPASAFRDVWKRLAAALVNHPAVFAYGLMNEPHHTGGLWHTVAQSGVDGIREIDAVRPIYVDGDGWSNSQNWPKENPLPFVNDPSKKIVYEAHIYFDDDFSGRYKTPLGDADVAARATQRLQPFLSWLTTHGQRGAIGETGVPQDDPRWLAALTKFLDMTDAACVDWFMWAGGGWRESYELSLEPINGKDRPQIKLLRSRL
ncbi:glycoside hydrolase family 5 protein [Propionivibrio sp.]|nr:glycoside hydrolase family 5 protein [Propionivibrio sp.]MBK7355813.1 glycoside hydrolase family 5 protein [Propionivibrio sp.]MBK8895213.1 glycoside hydrolase family 5 protein [Propionivibrio sp.]